MVDRHGTVVHRAFASVVWLRAMQTLLGAAGLGVVLGWLLATLTPADRPISTAVCGAAAVAIAIVAASFYGGEIAAAVNAAGLTLGLSTHVGLRLILEMRKGEQQ